MCMANPDIVFHMGVSKNSGTPKWMVKNGKPWKTLLKMDDLGGKSTIFGNIHLDYVAVFHASITLYHLLTPKAPLFGY